ncbi:ROK family transcriptional regulator [Brachybacterium kimchii]|uniref:ROK family transcriptional regulator n=1 Tax=Brachybacterium kimchii TaxID=2942909 RepID=A0ABY4N7F3_9MICO|nr:ROK family transcriptional regulator [Brachybacterium kimchii]UQN29284.1 ROK family transcriptional regulator [Brachybacterium kimchii]
MAMQYPQPAMERPGRRGTNLPRVAGYNQVLVLDLIRRSPGTSRSELVQRTGLTPQTLSNICQRLVTAGLIRESGRVRSGMGAPRIVYEVVPTGRYSIGLHIDPASLSLVLLDLTGDDVHALTVPTPQAPGPEHVLELVDEQVRALLEEAAVPHEEVAGLGVATPGPLDVEHGSVVGPPLLPGWGTVELREEIARRQRLPVVVEKDSTAAAIGEIWRTPRDAENLAFLYLGSGVSAGIVLDGQPLRGAGNAAGRLSHLGNIGHLTADPDGPPCECGGRGCVAVSSLPSRIVGTAVEQGALEKGTELDDARSVEAALSRLAERSEHRGDPVARKILEDAARGFARVGMQLANLLDLDSIVFGGPQWPAFEAACLRIAPSLVNEHYVAKNDHAVDVRGTAIGGHVGAVGAASLAMAETMFDAPGQLYLG